VVVVVDPLTSVPRSGGVAPTVGDVGELVTVVDDASRCPGSPTLVVVVDRLLDVDPLLHALNTSTHAATPMRSLLVVFMRHGVPMRFEAKHKR
jgi:hypothetical protein